MATDKEYSINSKGKILLWNHLRGELKAYTPLGDVAKMIYKYKIEDTSNPNGPDDILPLELSYDSNKGRIRRHPQYVYCTVYMYYEPKYPENRNARWTVFEEDGKIFRQAIPIWVYGPYNKQHHRG